jgi:acyl carrier protein
MDTFTTIQRLATERLDIPTETLLRARTFSEAGIDSLATLDLITDIEARFAIGIAPEDLDGVQSLHDLAAVVDRLVTRKSHVYEEALA